MAIARQRGMENDRGMRHAACCMLHAGAETLAVLGAYRCIVQVGCYDLTMPDIKYAGGHEKFRRLACLEQNAGIDTAPTTQNGPDLLPLEVQFGETERFFTMITGHDLRFQQGSASQPQPQGLVVLFDDAGAQIPPWQTMAQPWLDPRFG